MLIIAFVLALVLYIVLYFFASSLAPHLGGVTTTLQTLRALIFHIPDAAALLLLRELLIVTACYIAFDLMLSGVRLLMRRAESRRDAIRRRLLRMTSSESSESVHH